MYIYIYIIYILYIYIYLLYIYIFIDKYTLLFTCATTRCLHLELTPDMSAPTLIIAMRQFLARKRFPETFIFDNFKSFKFLRNNKIEWKFILDRSTWWGGFYERLVKVVKDSLYIRYKSLIRGPDNIVSVAGLTSSTNGKLIYIFRPLQKLILLEVRDNSNVELAHEK